MPSSHVLQGASGAILAALVLCGWLQTHGALQTPEAQGELSAVPGSLTEAVRRFWSDWECQDFVAMWARVSSTTKTRMSFEAFVKEFKLGRDYRIFLTEVETPFLVEAGRARAPIHLWSEFGTGNGQFDGAAELLPLDLEQEWIRDADGEWRLLLGALDPEDVDGCIIYADANGHYCTCCDRATEFR